MSREVLFQSVFGKILLLPPRFPDPPQGVWPQFPDFLRRFLSHVELAIDGSGCWVYIGAHDSRGYPNVVVPHGFPGAGKSRRMKGLRVSLTLFRGIVLGAREAHHLHRTDGFTCSRDCVNPDHGEGLTRTEHLREHGWNVPEPDLDFIF